MSALLPAPPLRPLLKSRVTGYQDEGAHTVYIVVTEVRGGRRFVARKRYSEFTHLHASILTADDYKLAPFPVPRRMLHNETVKQERTRALDRYISWAVSAAGDHPPPALLDFLGVDVDAAGIGEAAWRDVIAASSKRLSNGELFIKRVVASGSGGADAVGGERETLDAPPDESGPPPNEARAHVEFELSRDVYATAFVLASNATEGLYSFSPWYNRQMRLMWAYLAFIVASQAFVLACLVLFFPPVVDTKSFLIDCDAGTSPAAAVEALEAAGRDAAASSFADEWLDHLRVWVASAANGTVPLAVNRSPASSQRAENAIGHLPRQCSDTADSECSDVRTIHFSAGALAACQALDIELEIPLIGGRLASYRRLEVPTYFYQNVFRAALDAAGDDSARGSARGALLALLQLVCCVWVTVQVYFVDCRSVEALIAFRDFNRWLLPLKGERLRRNSWVLLIPLLQYTLACAIVGISCVITCACTAGFDAVMNSLAFTFISTIAEVFNAPLLRHYDRTAIAGLDPDAYGEEPIYYLVSEYDESNSYGPLEWSKSWYVRQGDPLAGLLTDFHFRHDPEAYPRPSKRLIALMRLVFFCVPPTALAVCYCFGGRDCTNL